MSIDSLIIEYAQLSQPLSLVDQKQLLRALLATYAKHCMGCEHIGWEELDAQVHDAIANVVDVYKFEQFCRRVRELS